MMKKDENIYNIKEIADKLSKSMYKAVKKALNNNKDSAKKIVEDILDDDNVAEVDPSQVASNDKIKVLHKKEDYKLLKSNREYKKSISKLKFFLERKNNTK